MHTVLLCDGAMAYEDGRFTDGRCLSFGCGVQLNLRGVGALTLRDCSADVSNCPSERAQTLLRSVLDALLGGL